MLGNRPEPDPSPRIERRELVLGTAGHIDHGKTALVRALTGVDTDRLPAEKRRGITIDLGFASLTIGEARLAVVDVPGHERFVRNMLAGATGMDLAMLVVAADDSVMPQTREHLEILKLLGLPGGLIVLTKCDLVEPEWAAMVEEDARELVRGSFLDGAPLVRTSAASGAGIAELRDRLADLATRAAARSDPGPFRLAIDREFTVSGHGTVVTGTAASGEVHVGDELEWHPEGRLVRVRGLQQHGHPVDRLSRGARAAINLAGVHHAEVRRGQELATPGYLRSTRLLAAEVRALADAPWPLRHRGRYRLHLGTAEVGASLSLFGGTRLEPGEPALAQIALAEPVVAVHGQPFVLRSESPPTTLGGGRVLQPLARRVRRRDRATIGRIDGLRSTEAPRRATTALTFRGLAPWTPRDLVRDAGIAEAEVGAVVDGLEANGTLVELPVGPRRSLRVTAEQVADLEARVLKVVGRLHDERPRQSAIRRSYLSSALPDVGSDALIAAVVDRLLASGQLTGDPRTVALGGFKPRLNQAERRAKETIAAAYRSAGLTPPDLPEVVEPLGLRDAVVQELLSLLVDEGHLVEIAKGLYLDVGAEAQLRKAVAERLADGSSLTMAELRDLLGVTRKHAVPFGEHLDTIGLTRREGDARRLNPSAEPAGTPRT